MRPYILSEAHYGSLQETEYEVAILPWGATEAHNLHLPYGTDNYETSAFAEAAAASAWEKGATCMVLPLIPMGVNTGQADIPFTLNLYPTTQAALINDIIESLHLSNIRKLLILNGHGGNDFKQILREAGRDFPDMFLLTANWFQSIDKTKYFTHDGDHADEMETSLMLHLHHELVFPLDEAGEGKAKNFAADILNEKWNWSERQWTKVTNDTGIGYPKEATKEKGEKYFKDVVEKLSKLIVEVSRLDPDSPYSE